MGGSSLSSSLSYQNSLLCSLGIKPFPPQFILLAAANHSSATTPVLSFLSDLIVFHLALPPLPNSPDSQSKTEDKDVSSRIDPDSHARDERNVQHKNRSHLIRQGALTVDGIDLMPESNISQEENLCFVKFYLAMWGYAPSSPFFALNSETAESRYLLLALGWLISHCDIFNRALEKRLCVFMGNKNTPLVTNTYLETSAMERGREAMGEAGQYVAKVFAASKRFGEGRARAKGLGEEVLMLNGRLRMTLRSLYALISCKIKRSHQLNQMQLEDNVRGPEGHPFSPFELHLLEHQKTLEKYLVTLEMVKCMIKAIVECNQHEREFWLWMAEVAAEARQKLLQQNSINVDQQDTDSSGAWTTNLLPVLSYFRGGLNGFCSADGITHLQTAPTSEGNDNNPAASQVDLVPTSIMTIWKDIQKRNIQKSISYFRTYNEDVVDPDTPFIEVFNSLHSHLLHKEAAGKSDLQCLDEELFKSVKDVATMLVSTLAQIRIRNRMVIEDALKVSMEKNDHFFVGL